MLKKIDVMGFLNEIQLDYPTAISFASGRPPQQFFEYEASIEAIKVFTQYLATEKSFSEEEIIKELGQYNRTKGIILELLLPFLSKNLEIEAKSSEIMVTVGAQEAMTLLALGFFGENELLLIENPAYIGMYEIAKLAKVEIDTLLMTNDENSHLIWEEKVSFWQSKGKKIKAFYTIPDFQNPSGTQMSLIQRKELLALAEKHDFYVIEDDAYGQFYYEEKVKLPTLKSMDKHGQVIYIGSFSKLLFPSLRLASVVANVSIIEQLTFVKGYTTVNTPAITQAVLGGLLLKYEFDFSALMQPKRDYLAKSRDILLDELAKNFVNPLITWNVPQGGFFLVITLPFEITEAHVKQAAADFGVLFCPMQYFYIQQNEVSKRQIRLAFSNVSEVEIKEGVKRLANFINLRRSY